MRTTVTLDPDTERIVRQRMREQKVSFKQALNDAIRDGAAGRPDVEFSTATVSMGRPTVNLDRALQIAAELEDDALIARLQAGS
ncbi:MAG: antitoxin [Acidimicrobiia bacterium]